MKKFTLLIFLMLCAFGFSQNAPITFETGEQGSTWSFASFENSTGIGYEKVSNPFATGINTSANVGKFTALVAGAPWAGCESAGIGKFTLNASNAIVKIMVYKSVISDVGLKFSIGNGGAQSEIKVKNTKINEWEELTFDCSSNIGKVESIDIEKIIFFLDFQARTTENVCYFDNVTFSAVPLATVPTSAATTPGFLAVSDVISLFSDAYANLAGTDFNPNWGQSTVHTDIAIAGNATKKYTNFNYQGIALASSTDVSAMTKLHLDLWSPDCTSFEVYLINPGPVEQKVTLTPTLSGWNSFDINLSDYTSINLATVFQLKMVSPTAGTTVYIDNLYFYKAPVVVPSSLNAPITFETGQFGSDWAFVSFENATGVGYEKSVNPSATGINTSATVGKFTALVAGAPWAGCESTGIGKFSLDATNSTVKIMVYKSVISDVGLKFSIASGGAQAEIKVKNTKINEWEELTFDCSANISKAESIDINKIIFFLDFQARTTENVCYFDNVTFSAKTTTPPGATVPTVAATTPAARPAVEVISLFSDAYANLVGTDFNPNWGQSTVHTDIAIVGNATKKYTNFNYQGIALASSTDVSAMTKLHLDLWSPDCTSFEVYLINPGPVEQKVTLTPTLSGWNSFDINLSDYTSINLATVFQLKMVSPTAGTTVYIDNLYFSKGTVTPPVTTDATLPLDFESASYAFVDFDGGAATKIANPDKSGINTSNNVGKMVKGAGQPWAGSKIKMASPIDFSTKKILKVKVWSPVAGKKLLLKFEGAGAAFEKEVVTTVANTWEELTFDYTGVAGVNNLNDNMVFIFDLGTVGDGSANSTYYFDDVTQPTTGPTLPLDFESASYAFVDFDGGAATKIANPDKSGINTSNNVGKMVKGAGQPWAGSKIKMASPIDFSTKKILKVKVWSPVAGKKLLLKFEGAGTAFEKEVATTVANTWEELTFDYTGVAGVNNLNDNMVFIFDLGTVGDGSANSTYYFDDVTQFTVGSTLKQMSLPVTFDDSTVEYGLIGFGGAEGSTVVVDPTLATNKVAKVVKSATAELWAGTTVTAAAQLGLSSPIPFTAMVTKMSVRVWSPNAGTIIRLKVEEHGDNKHTVETESTVTTASGWETVVFDFAKPVTGTAALNLAYKYDKASIFFGFGTTGAQQGAEKIYYFDDMMMAVIPTLPVLSYGVAAQTYPLGKSIYPLTITNTGGLVPANGYTISPALPVGLSFDTTTATISGTPTVLSQVTDYTVTGTNGVGNSSAKVSLVVVRDLKSNNFTIETTGETCLGEKNGEINIKALESHTYVAIINDKSYEFTANSLRVFNLAPGVYTISISVKGDSYVQSFTAVVPKGSTITGKINKSSFNKLTVVMTEGTAPYKVFLDGEEQFETPFSTFLLDVNKESLLEVKTAKPCEGTYSKNVEGLLDASAVYPNPTSGSFEIAIPTNRKEVVVDLYSLTSVFISSKTYPLENGTVKLSLDGQTAGVYIAKVYLDNPSYLKIIKK
ncbi:Secretion system C-terminal sorting domain [Flavobacteriaceae bacterium]